MDYRPSVFILPLSGCNSLGLARSFGRRGIAPYVFNSGKRQLDHLVSRYAKVVNAPEIDIKSGRYLDFIGSYAKSLKIRPVLFPVSDIGLLYVSQFRDSFSKFSHVPFADHGRVMTLLDKARFHEFVSSIGSVSQPRTFGVHQFEDACAAAREVGYPCILKPAFNHYFQKKIAKKCIYLECAEQLRSSWEECQIEGTSYIIQEIIPGRQLYGWTGYYDTRGVLSAHCSYWKIRQYPIDFGVGTLFRVEEKAELLRQGNEVLERLGFHGIVDVEFKYDLRDGLWKIIEINPRTAMHNALAAAAGADIEFMAYCDMTGVDAGNNRSAQTGFVWTETHKDLAAVLDAGRGLSGWRTSRRGEKVYSYFAKDDPLPSVARMNEFVGTILVASLRALAKRR